MTASRNTCHRFTRLTNPLTMDIIRYNMEMILFPDVGNGKGGGEVSYFCKNRRFWSLLTALLVASVLLLSGLFIVTHGKHDCTGQDCRVCSEIKVCVSTIRVLSEAVGTGAAVVFVYIAAHKLVFSYTAGFFLCPASLVSLKIRLDD